jgi:hypothetical protein
MWLPTPIYERVTQFWLLIGLLFMSSGTYLGFDYSLSFLYFGVGIVCIIWSGTVYVRRARYRSSSSRNSIPTITEENSQDQEQEQATDQTETPAGHTN